MFAFNKFNAFSGRCSENANFLLLTVKVQTRVRALSKNAKKFKCYL